MPTPKFPVWINWISIIFHEYGDVFTLGFSKTEINEAWYTAQDCYGGLSDCHSCLLSLARQNGAHQGGVPMQGMRSAVVKIFEYI